MKIFLIKSNWSKEYIKAKDIGAAINIYQVYLPKEIVSPDRDIVSTEYIGTLLND